MQGKTGQKKHVIYRNKMFPKRSHLRFLHYIDLHLSMWKKKHIPAKLSNRSLLHESERIEVHFKSVCYSSWIILQVIMPIYFIFQSWSLGLMIVKRFRTQCRTTPQLVLFPLAWQCLSKKRSSREKEL